MTLPPSLCGDMQIVWAKTGWAGKHSKQHELPPVYDNFFFNLWNDFCQNPQSYGWVCKEQELLTISVAGKKRKIRATKICQI